MKFGVGKYKVLHLGRNNSSSKDRLGAKLEINFAQKLGSSVQERLGHTGVRPGRSHQR